MPHTTLREMSACLWDLQAQCEEQVRVLTDAQRLTGDFANRPTDRDLIRGRLMSDLDVVLRAVQHVGRGAQHCADLIRRLPAVAEDEAPV